MRCPGRNREGAAATDQDQQRRDQAAESSDRTILDEVEDRLRFRAFFAKHAWLDLTYRIAVAVLGGAVVVLGVVLIPLPGPGWLIVFAGLAILATEFAWAERLRGVALDKVSGWTAWVARQSLLVRGLITLGGLLVVVAAFWLYRSLVGLPEWVPFD